MSNVEIKISNDLVNIQPGIISGALLHNLAGITPPQQLVISRHNAMDVPIEASDYIIVEGGEVFAIGDGDPPIADNPCLRVGINFFLNGKKFKDDSALYKAKLTGAEIKALDGIGQQTDGLFAELNGIADEPIQDDWRIVVQNKDRFITVPCGNVGEQATSTIQTFEDQLAETNRLYGEVDIVPNGKLNLVIIRNVSIPEGWNHDTVDLMIQVPQNYPPSALDMFWVFPHIKFPNGVLPNRGDIFEQHAGINWQRFSWHYKDRRWHPVRDSLSSHIKFCLARLDQKH